MHALRCANPCCHTSCNVEVTLYSRVHMIITCMSYAGSTMQVARCLSRASEHESFGECRRLANPRVSETAIIETLCFAAVIRNMAFEMVAFRKEIQNFKGIEFLVKVYAHNLV